MRTYLRGSANPMWKGGRYTHELGYIMVYAPEHPRAHQSGYVFEHLLVAEKALGRYLPRQVQVHHINEIKNENRNSNLVICENQQYHALLHQRTFALRETGSVHSRKCCFCKQWMTVNDSVLLSNRRNWRHRECHAAYERNRLSPKRKTPRRIKYTKAERLAFGIPPRSETRALAKLWTETAQACWRENK